MTSKHFLVEASSDICNKTVDHWLPQSLTHCPFYPSCLWDGHALSDRGDIIHGVYWFTGEDMGHRCGQLRAGLEVKSHSILLPVTSVSCPVSARTLPTQLLVLPIGLKVLPSHPLLAVSCTLSPPHLSLTLRLGTQFYPPAPSGIASCLGTRALLSHEQSALQQT